MADGVEEAPILRDHSGRLGQLVLRPPPRDPSWRLRLGALEADGYGFAPMARIVTYVHRIRRCEAADESREFSPEEEAKVEAFLARMMRPRDA
jgi:hypothetical protein